MAPSWRRENSINPPEYEPAIPRALTICLSFSPSSRPAATAAPKVPVNPGAWKPLFSRELPAATPMRDITSHAATNAVSSDLPSAFFSSATAKAGRKAVAPG